MSKNRYSSFHKNDSLNSRSGEMKKIPLYEIAKPSSKLLNKECFSNYQQTKISTDKKNEKSGKRKEDNESNKNIVKRKESIFDELYKISLTRRFNILKRDFCGKNTNLNEIENDKECTFKPNLTFDKLYFLINEPFDKRIEKWNKMRAEKIRKSIDERVTRKDINCTFQPNIQRIDRNSNRTKEMIPNIESIENFVNAKKKFFNIQIKEKERLENFTGSGKKWSISITKPNPFNFRTRNKILNSKTRIENSFFKSITEKSQ